LIEVVIPLLVAAGLSGLEITLWRALSIILLHVMAERPGHHRGAA
jgi:hypothetical protein